MNSSHRLMLAKKIKKKIWIKSYTVVQYCSNLNLVVHTPLKCSDLLHASSDKLISF